MSQTIARFYGIGANAPSVITASQPGTVLWSKTISPGLPSTKTAGSSLGDLALPNQLLVLRQGLLSGQDFQINIAGRILIGPGVTNPTFGIILANNQFLRTFTPFPGTSIIGAPAGEGGLFSVGGTTLIEVTSSSIFSATPATLVAPGEYPFSLVARLNGSGTERIVGLSTRGPVNGAGLPGTEIDYSGGPQILQGEFEFSLDGELTTGATTPLAGIDFGADPALSLTIGGILGGTSDGSVGAYVAKLTQFEVAVA